MKILYVVKTNDGAGWAYRHAEWIIKHYKDYEFVIAMPSVEGGFADKYKELGCKIIPFDMSLPVSKPWDFFKKKKEIKKIIAEEKPDIIHSHFVTTTFMLRLSLWRDETKRIFQVPGPLHLERPIFRFIDKITIRENDYLVGSCKWTCETYKKMGIPENRIYLDYYGGYKKEIDETSTKLRNEYGITQDTPLIGMVSYFYAPKYYLLQFRGLKGHEDFIDAMKIVREKIPQAKGIIIGSAWGKAKKYEERVKKYARKNCPNGIIFTGYRNDVAEIYHELNVAVHPSHSENIGGAGESLGLAVPTISTNVGGFPDIVIDGETGWAVEKKNPKQLADRVIWMIEHKEISLKMAKEGQKLGRSMLGIDITAEKIKNIYEEILNL